MKIELFIQLLCIIMVVVLLIAVSFTNRNATKEQIMKYLTGRGAINVHIEHNIFDGDRGTSTFSIYYTGIRGNRHSITCKARSGIFSTGELFWSELPELSPLPGEEAAPVAPKNDPDQFSEKIRAHFAREFPTYQIIKILPILGSEDQIILLNTTGHSFQNLLRCHADGEIVWQANDIYVDVQWHEGELTAVNESNITVTLNLKTGKILPSQDG